jgi:glucosamine-6-phosphate deaminase
MHPLTPLERNHHEHVPLAVFRSSAEASRAVAAEIAALIHTRQREGRPCVLGLATGSTPVSVYAELVRLHREEKLSFAHVTTFNLDEYHPLAPEQPQSYRHFMRTHLFDDVDLDPARTHLPSGTVPKAGVDAHCADYEAMIAAAAGLDFQLLGIAEYEAIEAFRRYAPADFVRHAAL